MTTRGRSDDATGAPGATLGDLLTDCADRLRRLPESRLTKVAEPARGLAQFLADAAAGAEGRAGVEAPRRRLIPALSVFALGDQIVVTATDLSAVTAALDGAEPVWWQGGRHPLAEVLEALAGAAEALRAQL